MRELPVTAEDRFSIRDQLLALSTAQGFEFAAIARPTLPADVGEVALHAREQGHYAEMAWMNEDWTLRSISAEKFLPGCSSILVLGMHTAPPAPLSHPGDVARGRVARYAWGRDYHRVFEKRLRTIAKDIRENLGGESRSTVDYGPLLERSFAAVAGLGWLGKSTMLLVPGAGPWVLLGAVATTLGAEPGQELRKSCGSCERCVKACPTGALGPSGDSSTHDFASATRQLKTAGQSPRDLRPKMGSWVFGCDECLTSCPVGSGSPTSSSEVEDREPALTPLLELDEESFRERFRGRAVNRARRDGLVRNACIALGNVGGLPELPALFGALEDESPLVRGHAAWAIARLTRRAGAERRLSIDVLESSRRQEADTWVLAEVDDALDELRAP